MAAFQQPAGAGAPPGAAPPSAQPPRFAARARLVQVPVTVADGSGRPFASLEAPDFAVLDNGRPQKAIVDTIDTGVAPVALVIAVQSSGISAAVLEKVQKVAAMIHPLVVGGRGCAGLVSFAERVNWLQDCTKDADALGRAFLALRPGEHREARMLDAVSSAIEHLSRQPNARRVLLLVSESRDRGSEAALDSVALAAMTADVTIYAATYSAFNTAMLSKVPVSLGRQPQRPRSANETMGTITGTARNPLNPKVPPPEQRVDLLAGIEDLARLTKEKTTESLAACTGGTEFPFTKRSGLEGAIQRLGTELHSQYVLSFVPEDPAPGYHRLEVRVSRPGGLHLRARPGYWSAP